MHSKFKVTLWNSKHINVFEWNYLEAKNQNYVFSILFIAYKIGPKFLFPTPYKASSNHKISAQYDGSYAAFGPLSAYTQSLSDIADA